MTGNLAGPRDALLWGATAPLLAFAAWPWARWALHEPEGRPEAAASAPAALPALPSLEAFREIVERPLLAPNRRPAAHAAAAPSQGLRLEGVVVVGALKRAILKRSDGTTARLAEGETIGEWTVRRIEPERVLLTAGDRRLELAPQRAGSRR